MKDYLHDFFKDFNYPAEACEELLSAYVKIASHAEAGAIFSDILDTYGREDKFVTADVLDRSKKAGELVGVHAYTAQFLIFCCFTRHLREMYRRSGYSDEMWRGTVSDLRAKLFECHDVYGIWGSFVAFWFDGFYLMTRFALGRLEYEVCPFYACDEYSRRGVNIRRDEKSIMVHIPSGKKLLYDEVIDSYKKAYAFYGDMLCSGRLVLQCHSWLFQRDIKKILPEGSNLRRFTDDFDITKAEDEPDFEDCWRIFSMDYNGDPASLPRDTSLRRSFAEYLDGGGVPGTGFSVLVFDGERVIKD